VACLPAMIGDGIEAPETPPDALQAMRDAVRATVEGMTSKNWRAAKTEILKLVAK